MSVTGAVMEGHAGTERSKGGPNGAKIPGGPQCAWPWRPAPSMAGSGREQGLETDPSLTPYRKWGDPNN